MIPYYPKIGSIILPSGSNSSAFRRPANLHKGVTAIWNGRSNIWTLWRPYLLSIRKAPSTLIDLLAEPIGYLLRFLFGVNIFSERQPMHQRQASLSVWVAPAMAIHHKDIV